MHDKTIAELAAALQARTVSSVELTQHMLQRIKTHDAALNSFVTLTGEQALAQAGGILALYDEDETVTKNKLMLFRGIEKAKFRRTVVPGDQLHLHAKLLKKKRNFVTLATKAMVDGEVATEAEISALVSDE